MYFIYALLCRMQSSRVHTCTYVYIQVRTYIYRYVRICMYVHVSTYTEIGQRTQIYTYICMHIRTYVHYTYVFIRDIHTLNMASLITVSTCNMQCLDNAPSMNPVLLLLCDEEESTISVSIHQHSQWYINILYIHVHTYVCMYIHVRYTMTC